MRISDLLLGYVLGVASSASASVLVFILRTRFVIRKAAKFVADRERAATLRAMGGKVAGGDNSHYGMVRSQWAYALRDLGSEESGLMEQGAESLRSMADILREEERRVAYEAVRLRYATNVRRDLDTLLVNVMQRLREEATGIKVGG